MSTTQPSRAAAPPPPVRMTLASIARKREDLPPRVVLYTPEGVGKTTFGADSESPIFIAAEDGIREFQDLAAFPQPETLKDIYDAIAELTTGQHDFRTLVIDTIDFVEPLIHKEICRREGAHSIEAVGSSDGVKKGYGKGFSIAIEELRLLLGRLDALREKRKMGVIVLGHAQVGSFDDPMGDAFMRYELAMNKKAAIVLKAWADVVLFGNFVDTRHKSGPRVKGIGSGARMLFTERTAGFDAKNRRGLPPQMPLGYAAFADAYAAGREVNEGEVLKACRELIAELKLPADHKAVAFVEAQKNNPTALVKALNRLRAIAAENQPAEPAKE